MGEFPIGAIHPEVQHAIDVRLRGGIVEQHHREQMAAAFVHTLTAGGISRPRGDREKLLVAATLEWAATILLGCRHPAGMAWGNYWFGLTSVLATFLEEMGYVVDDVPGSATEPGVRPAGEEPDGQAGGEG